MEKFKSFDFIVIGSGLAGLNFSLAAAEKKYRVLVVTKNKPDFCATNFAQGGIAAVISKNDSFKKHIEDTLAAGCFHNNKKAVKYMIEKGPSAIARLSALGVNFEKQGKDFSLTREGGHSAARVAFSADETGKAIEKMLLLRAKKSPFIKIMPNTFAADLLIKNKKCFGLRILRKNKFENIYAGAVVLACGGIGRIYKNTTNPNVATGDGIGLALRAGCKLKDMEFMQFHPTALSLKGRPRFLISESMRGEGAFLVNSKGKRFMLGLHRLAELAPRDIVSRAIFEQEKSGPVYLDMRHKNAKKTKMRFPKIYKTLKSYGIDMTHDLIPISPAAHYLCGGIKVDLKGKTSIKNLYAFGENACTGAHGANRLASNSLLEAVVFSNNVPNIPAAKNNNKIPIFKTLKFEKLSKKEKLEIKKMLFDLQKTMWDCAGIIRNKTDLQKALQKISALENKLRKINKNNRETLELLNMIQTAALIVKAALRRKQSLGCHFRKD